MALSDLIAAEAGGAEAAEGPELVAAEAAPAPKSEDLGVDGDEGGRPGPVPYSRFAEVNVKRKAEAERAAKAEARARELEEKHGAFSKDFEALYGKFEKPVDQLKEDAAFAEAWWALKDDPDVKRALAKIQQHHQGAVKVSDRQAKPEAAAAPASDPRVEDLVREGIRDKARIILGESKVRDQLHGPILDYVLAQGVKPTREAIITAMREYVGAQGWTNEFLRGSGAKPKPSIVPNPGGLNAGAPKKDAPQATARPKSLSEVEQANRTKFRELIQQKLG